MAIVNGRDRSKLIDSATWQASVVSKVLGPSFDDVEVYSVLCFVDGNFGYWPMAHEIDNVTVLWPGRLRKQLRGAGPISPDLMLELGDTLGGSLRAAA